MWLIVGLGNPGSKYERTRHNIGFLVLEKLIQKNDLEFSEKKDFRICKGSIENSAIILMEPLTFMNRSGTAVRRVAEKYNIPPEKIMVIHDDLDMEIGKLKIRRRGSSGGHRGIDSIIQNLGSSDFIRVKIGIGRDEYSPTEDYVLSKFSRHELPLIKKSAEKAVDAIETIIKEGVERAMNRFN
ncbi:MAG: aminoacyl-tRNA hydrolase [Nitrospirota bacterium]